MPFRFQSEKVHLSYKTHMDEPAVKAMLECKGTLKIHSFVHKVGDDNENKPTPLRAHGSYLQYVTTKGEPGKDELILIFASVPLEKIGTRLLGFCRPSKRISISSMLQMYSLHGRI